jgi:hypothetical protein
MRFSNYTITAFPSYEHLENKYWEDRIIRMKKSKRKMKRKTRLKITIVEIAMKVILFP